MTRFLPLSIGGITTFFASIQDINLGAIAGGITAIGLALSAAYWQFASGRTRAYREAEAAKLKVYQDSEAAKLLVFEAAERARIRLQHEADEANKASLSSQMSALQRSVDEANRRLQAAEMLAASQKEVIDGLREKSHATLNALSAEKTAREFAQLQHQRENTDSEAKVAEVLAKLESARGEVAEARAEVARLREENSSLNARLAEMLTATNAKVEANAAKIADLKGGGQV